MIETIKNLLPWGRNSTPSEIFQKYLKQQCKTLGIDCNQMTAGSDYPKSRTALQEYLQTVEGEQFSTSIRVCKDDPSKYVVHIDSRNTTIPGTGWIITGKNLGGGYADQVTEEIKTLQRLEADFFTNGNGTAVHAHVVCGVLLCIKKVESCNCCNFIA